MSHPEQGDLSEAVLTLLLAHEQGVLTEDDRARLARLVALAPDGEPIGWTETVTPAAPRLGEPPREFVDRQAPARVLEGQPVGVWLDWLTRASQGLTEPTVWLGAEMSEADGAPYVSGRRAVT